MGSKSPPAAADAERPERDIGWWDQPLVVLDTATTGTDPLTARIVQVACLAVFPDGRVSNNSCQAVVNAGVPIDAEAVAVHGISEARMVREGVPLVDALYQVVRRIDQWSEVAPVVIFNATYDWPLVWEELGRTELVWTAPLAKARLVDPLVLEREFNGVAKGHYSNQLADVAKRYGIDRTDAHSAYGDAVATAAIVRAQVRAYRPLRTFTLEDLQEQQRCWYRGWRDELNAYNERKHKSWRVTGEWPFGDRRRTTT